MNRNRSLSTCEAVYIQPLILRVIVFASKKYKGDWERLTLGENTLKVERDEAAREGSPQSIEDKQ